MKLMKIACPYVQNLLVGLLALLIAACSDDPDPSPTPTPETFIVTFEANGGTSVSQQQIEKDKTASKPDAPTRNGFIFENWYSDEALTDVFDFTTTITENITLYAKWTEVAEGSFVVSFRTDGGSSVDPQPVEGGNTAEEPNPAPTREGHTFAGWFIDSDFRNAFAFTTSITENITLYAKWDVNTYAVNFETNGGSDIQTQNVEFEKTASEPQEPPTRGEDTFAGWFTDNNTFQSAFDFDNTPITGDITLYAKWVTSYTVTFNANEGAAVDPQTVEEGQTASSPTPTRQDHTLVGWFTDNALENEFDFETPITGDITLYAKWVPESTPERFYILDDNFRNKLKSLLPPEAFDNLERLMTKLPAVAERQELDLARANIADLTGIEYFTALTTLKCNSNGDLLTSLDVSKNTALEQLWCDRNALTSLNVSQNTELTLLRCQSNALASLDVSENTALTYLDCSNNELTILNVSENTALTYLDCSNNELTSLDALQNTALTYLDCSNNELTILNVSRNTALERLDCYQNELTSLDLSQNTVLTSLRCYTNKLTDLDMRGMRGANTLTLIITSNTTNQFAIIKVHVNVQNDSKIDEIKTRRGNEVTIETYTSPVDDPTNYTRECGDYTPRTKSCAG